MENTSEPLDFASALDVVQKYITEADEKYAGNQSTHAKMEAQVAEVKKDLEDLAKKKIQAHKELESIAKDLDTKKAAFLKDREEFEEALEEAKKLRDELEAREQAAANKMAEANAKLAAADTRMQELHNKDLQLRDLEGVINSRR